MTTPETENPNGCAEPIAQVLERCNVPRNVIQQVLEEQGQLYHLKNRRPPRTIVLAYTPGRSGDGTSENGDCLDSWSVHEEGRIQDALDSRECLALVAAMLLGAPHPPLTPMWGLRGAVMDKQRECAQRISEAHESVRAARAELDRVRALWFGLPWDLAAKVARAQGLHIAQDENRDGILTRLVRYWASELADTEARNAAREGLEPRTLDEIAEGKLRQPRPDDAASWPEVVGSPIRAVREVTEAEAIASAAEHPAVLMVRETDETAIAPAPDRPLLVSDPIVIFGREPHAIEHELTAEVVEYARHLEQFADLSDALTEAGYERMPAEIDQWPEAWQIEAQNFANAYRLWSDQQTSEEYSGNPHFREAWSASEPRAPWFLSGNSPTEDPEQIPPRELRSPPGRLGGPDLDAPLLPTESGPSAPTLTDGAQALPPDGAAVPADLVAAVPSTL